MKFASLVNSPFRNRCLCNSMLLNIILPTVERLWKPKPILSPLQQLYQVSLCNCLSPLNNVHSISSKSTFQVTAFFAHQWETSLHSRSIFPELQQFSSVFEHLYRDSSDSTIKTAHPRMAPVKHRKKKLHLQDDHDQVKISLHTLFMVRNFLHVMARMKKD